jgi:hypothetical protein
MADARTCEVEATLAPFSHVKTECLLYNIKILSVPHRKHYVSATKISGLILLRETAVYCENHTKQTYTLCGQNAEF